MVSKLQNGKAGNPQDRAKDKDKNLKDEIQLSLQSRHIWTVCAAVSLLSSKYLIVDLNVHFPLHLHLVQLATATIFTVLYVLRQTQHSRDAAQRPSMVGWLFLVLLACLMAGSVVLSLQAVLHFQNITTLVMLSTISHLVKLVITDRSRFKWLQCFFLTLSCAGILRGEYRLLFKGLLSSIPAALLAGLAGVLHSVAANRLPSAVSNPERINMLFCSLGLGITISWALQAESTPAFQHSVRLRYVPMLAVNALSTASAIVHGRSFLFPLDTVELSHSPKSRIGNAVTMLALSGVVGCATMLMPRRSYTTHLQVFAFFVAQLCIGGNSAFIAVRWNRDGQGGCALLAPPSRLGFMASDKTKEMRELIAMRGSSHRFFVQSLLVGLIVASLWVVFPVLNFQERLYVKTIVETPHLDLEYTPTVGAELVISMYQEPVPDVAFLISTLRAMPSLSDAAVHIYVKDNSTNLDSIQRLTSADNVTLLPNIGREGETYLYHILNRWDSLAKHTVFLQANVHNPREFYPRVRDYYDPSRTGMMSLGWSGHACNCEECGDQWSFWDSTRLFPEIYHRIHGDGMPCKEVLLSYKGQFIASAARIRGVDRGIYEDLRKAFVDKNSWAHQEAYLKGREDSMSAPVFGYTMERMWNLLMQCSTTNASWKCPTLLSGSRLGGNTGDCQCFERL